MAETVRRVPSGGRRVARSALSLGHRGSVGAHVVDLRFQVGVSVEGDVSDDARAATDATLAEVSKELKLD